MAIVSKAVFEQLAKQKGGATLGARLGLDRYGSTHKALAPLAEGGALFAVTVRPPSEALWLVAVLEQPTLRDDGWYASPSAIAITDVSHLKDQLRFASGKGLTAAAGALGMSLQTPRTLSAEDEALLRAAAGTAAAAQPAPASPAAKSAPAPSKPLAVKPIAEKAPTKQPAATPPATTPSPAATPHAAMSPGLDTLATALHAGDGAAALRAALTCWQEHPWPELADLVDAISAQISGPPAEDERGFSTLAKSKDPLVLGQILPAIRGVPVSFLPVAAEVLATFPKDPRLAAAIADWALDPPTTSSSTYSFWVRVLGILARSGDVRVLPRLRQRLATQGGTSAFWPKFTTAVGKAADTLAAVTVPALSAADAARIAELARAVPRLRSEPATVTAKAERAPTVEGPPLVQAAAHLAANRIPAAIEALLVCWRETRVPAVADAIDRATRLLPTWEKPLDALDEKSAHEAWLAAFAEDPALHLPQLLQYVRVGGSTAATHHVTELATLPDDPRMATHLSAVAAMFGVSPEKAQYWRTLFEIVARARDVRTCAPLRADFRDFASTYWYHHKHGRRIVGPFVFDPASVFPQWPLALDPASQQQFELVLGRLAEAEARADQTERKLLAEIAEAWSDQGPRLVYADWLSDRGHPRGELIVLACKKNRTKAEEQRLATLRAVPYLMGALSDFVSSKAELDRGLLGELPLDGVGAFTFRALRGHPLLAVVSSMVFDRTNEDRFDVGDFARVIVDPALVRLATVASLSAPTLDALAPLVGERFERKGTKLVRRA